MATRASVSHRHSAAKRSVAHLAARASQERNKLAIMGSNSNTRRVMRKTKDQTLAESTIMNFSKMQAQMKILLASSKWKEIPKELCKARKLSWCTMSQSVSKRAVGPKTRSSATDSWILKLSTPSRINISCRVAWTTIWEYSLRAKG